MLLLSSRIPANDPGGFVEHYLPPLIYLVEMNGGQHLDMALIDPGKPWQNGVAESFSGKFRDECLSMEWFRNRIEAKVVIEEWRQHYNEIRPHSSLGNQTPAAFERRCVSTAQPETVLQE